MISDYKKKIDDLVTLERVQPEEKINELRK